MLVTRAGGFVGLLSEVGGTVVNQTGKKVRKVLSGLYFLL